MNHTVPAVAYMMEDRKGRALLYTGDTGPTNEIWCRTPGIDAVIVDVSFPNGMEALARKTGHLTAGLLAEELGKIKHFSGRVFVTHPKHRYIARIEKEIHQIGMRNIEMLRDGKVYEI